MYSAISANKRNTVIIMAVFIGMVAAIGWAISAALWVYILDAVDNRRHCCLYAGPVLYCG